MVAIRNHSLTANDLLAFGSGANLVLANNAAVSAIEIAVPEPRSGMLMLLSATFLGTYWRA